jgi:hypothetical protein
MGSAQTRVVMDKRRYDMMGGDAYQTIQGLICLASTRPAVSPIADFPFSIGL